MVQKKRKLALKNRLYVLKCLIWFKKPTKFIPPYTSYVVQIKNMTLSVFEHDRLIIGTNGFTKAHLDALARWSETQKLSFFTLRYNSVKFGQYVGVLKVGDLTIEILTKIDRKTSENDQTNWQNVLLKMLIRSRMIPIHPNNTAQLKVEKHRLFEAFIALFLVEIEQIIADGLVKKYRTTEGNQNALKGRLLFAKNISHNVVHQERFYTAHTTYDTQHLLHQILWKTLQTIRKIGGFYPKLDRLCFDFPEMENISIAPKTFQNLVFTRQTERYRSAIQFAELILFNYFPDITQGNKAVLAILFDMNVLWERFVAAELQANLKDYNVNLQTTTTFWGSKTLRPDIVLTHRETEEKIVIDTKWKLPENDTPSDADLKQMFVYHHYFDAQKTILLYPNYTDIIGDFEPFKQFSNLKLKLSFLNIIENNGLKTDFDFQKFLE
jgi:5-methylcytosine-specific restriction enzyme subunit McrC